MPEVKPAAEPEQSTLDKIQGGAYSVGKLDVRPPKLDPLLRMSISEMDEQQIEQMLELHKAHKEAKELYELAVVEHEQKKEELIQQLKADLEAEFQITPSEKADLLFGLCRDYANNDLTQLYGFYDDMCPLLK